MHSIDGSSRLLTPDSQAFPLSHPLTLLGNHKDALGLCVFFLSHRYALDSTAR